MVRLTICLLVVAAAWTASTAQAGMYVTEWMYSQSASGSPGEFIELTNVGLTDVDLTDWSQDDNNRVIGKHSLTSFGTVKAGESVILTEASESAFRTYWGLGAAVKIISYGSNDNLGRADEINLWDNNGTLIDRLTYDDQNSKGPRTQGTSANIPLGALGKNTPNSAVLSKVGDSYLSYRAGGSGDLANPGVYTQFVVPEPSSLALLAMGVVGSLAWLRRKGR